MPSRSPPVIKVVHINPPKLIHTDPANFRALVQQLTGNSPQHTISSMHKKAHLQRRKKTRRCTALSPPAASQTGFVECRNSIQNDLLEQLPQESMSESSVPPMEEPPCSQPELPPYESSCATSMACNSVIYVSGQTSSSHSEEDSGSSDASSAFGDFDIISALNSSCPLPEIPQLPPLVDTCHEHTQILRYQWSWLFPAAPAYPERFE